MMFPNSVFGQFSTILFLLSVASAEASSTPNLGLWNSKTPIESLQPLLGDSVFGAARKANTLRPKTKYNTFTLAYHRDSGNTRADDYLGPLGDDVMVESIAGLKPAPLYWDEEARLTAGAICNDTTTCLVALDPVTFDVKATWSGATDQGSELIFPFFTYSTMYQGRYIAPAIGPRILEIGRTDNDNGTTFDIVDEKDLSALVGDTTQIINSQYDADGNLWFTTGSFQGAGIVSPRTTSVIGYFSPSGVIHYLELPNSSIENGIAVTGSIVYLVTGPAGETDHANATGYLYAFEPTSEGNGIKILFQEGYDAGDRIKPGGISRGSGSSPTLLGDEYVVITDNSDERINLLFFRQVKGSEQRTGRGPVCKVPLFAANNSANENTLGSHFNGETYSVIVTNSYNAPQVINFFNASTTIDDPNHRVLNAGPGFVRVDFDPRENVCGVRWEADIRATGIPTLSTASGLIYQYAQDLNLARNGSYVWYMHAVDYLTGEIAWRVRTGAGALFNNNYQSPTLGPDGSVYNWVLGGLVKVSDGNRTGEMY